MQSIGLHKVRDSANTTKGGGKRKNRDLRRAVRREEAEERQAESEERTAEDQLEKLRAGGHGSCGEARAIEKVLHLEQKFINSGNLEKFVDFSTQP